MARIRTIKPEFWTDDALTECSLSARLLFIGTWNFADDFGNLDRSAKQIKARVFPLDNVDCEPLLRELLAQKLLVEYEVDGKKFLHIRGFTKHQVINRPSKPTVPGFAETHTTLTEYSVSTPSGRERKGKERKKEREPPPAVAGLDLVSWERWVEYRSEIRKALKPASIPAAQKALAAFGTDQAKVVEQSIANGWQGLFPLNTKQAFTARPVGEADRAWSDLITSDGAKRDNRVQRAIDAVGGWLAIKARTPFTEAKLREQFCRAYSEAA